MSNWKEMAKRLRKNQEKNKIDYTKQDSIIEKRIMFLKQIEDEKAKVLSSTRRKRNFETQTKSSSSQKGFDR